MKNEIWLIVGASSSMGKAFAHKAAQSGCGLILAGRDLQDIEITASDLRHRYGLVVTVVLCDITDDQACLKLVNVCTKVAVKLNVYVCIGAMIDNNKIIEQPLLLQQIIAVNFTGISTLLLLLLPCLEKQAAAKVIVIGSVAGDVGRYSNFAYGSAKAGLHAFISGYQALCWQKGIHVSLVKPGFVDTTMTYGLPNMFAVAPVKNLADSCWHAVYSSKAIIYFPRFWRLIMLLIASLPQAILRRMKI